MSTTNQKLERQLLRQLNDEILYNDVVSGYIAFKEREQGQQLLIDIEKVKIKYVSVSSIDRLGRSTLDILSTIDYLSSYKVNLRVDNLGIESLTEGKPNLVFNLVVSVMSNVSQMERELLFERQRQGIALAKAKGVYKGRIRGIIESQNDFLAKHKK